MANVRLSCWCLQKVLFYWSITDTHYISFRCATYWFNICIQCKVIPISPATVCHQSYLSFFLWWEYLRFMLLVTFKFTIKYYWLYSSCCTLHSHDLFILYMEVCTFLIPFAHFTHSINTLPSGNHQPVCEFGLVLVFLFIYFGFPHPFLGSTYKQNHAEFAFHCLTFHLE